MARKLVTKAQGRTIASNVTAFGPWTKGVNEKNEVFLLNSDELSGASNIVLDDTTGIAHKRPGSIFVGTLPFLTGTPTVAFVFIDSSGKEILLVTDDKRIIATENFITYTDITPSAYLLGGVFSGNASNMDFATAEGRVWIANGVDPVCSWDGQSNVVVYDKATTEVAWNGPSDTQLSLSDAQLDRASIGTTWVGQVITCTFATNLVNLGQSQKVTAFDDTTDTVSFLGFPGVITNGDKFMVGVLIPRGRYLKYHHNTLFVACTPENPQEIRFHNDVDPNEPGITIQIDNPNAWPPVNQIEVDGGGDRIWGFTNPVYRNRIGVFKSTGLYRIEPDPTFRFVPVTITEQFGSRFPRSWQQKGEVLMFLGQDTDGKPDVMTTDFVTVKHFNRKHSKTLDNLLQPRTVFKSRYFSNDASWSTGTKSTFCNSSSGALVPGSPLDSVVNLPKTETGPIDTSGIADLNALPWLYNGPLNGGNGEFNGHSFGHGGLSGAPSTLGATLDNYFIPGKSVLISCRMRFNANDPSHTYTMRIGNNGLESTLVLRQVGAPGGSTFNGAPITGVAIGSNQAPFVEVTIFLKNDGFTILTMGGLEVSRAAPSASTLRGVSVNDVLGPVVFSAFVSTNFIINSDCEHWGTIRFINDNLINPTQSNPILAVGSLAGGVVSVWSRTSDTIDFTVGNDPAGYVLVANGSAPTSLLKRYQEVIILTSWATRDWNTGFQPTQTVENIYGNSTWISPTIFIGPNISAWLAYIANVTSPVGTFTLMRIRYAITSGPPTPVDFSPYFAIVNGMNIGSAIGDIALPPNARWIEITVEQGISLSNLIPKIESINPTWFEGGGITLLSSSVIYNKKWLLTATRVSSAGNDIILQVDSNDAFSNWEGLNANFMVWFRGKLHINRGADVLELTPSVLDDDIGPGIGGARLTTPIASYLETNQEISGAGSVRKKPRYLDMMTTKSGPTIELLYKRDDQAAFTPFRTVPFPSGTRQQRLNLPLGFQYRRLIWRMENAQAGTDLGLDGLIMFYALVPSVSGK